MVRVKKAGEEQGLLNEIELSNDAVTGILKAFQQAAQQIADSIQQASNEQIVEPVLKTREELDRAWKRIGPEMLAWYEALPKANRLVFAGLCMRGWYPSGTMPVSLVAQLGDSLLSGDLDHLDWQMAAFTTEHEESIQGALEARFPARARVLQSAFSAHRQRKYSLAIPVFLAQADGTCYELLGGKLFSVDRRTHSPRAASKLHAVALNPISASLLSPLEIIGALIMNADEAARLNPPLNRHEVLHGRSSNYGTRLNSLRCISLLGFLTSIVASSKISAKVSTKRA